MSETHLSTPAGPRSAIRPRLPPLRTTSPAPARQQHLRVHDDLLSRLTPATAVEALQAPDGPLKKCLERASVSEQAFALKTAIASKTIRTWLDELSEWPWPSADPSAGFETPPPTRRKLFDPKASSHTQGPISESDVTHYGSLPAEDVTRYEKRIDDINQDMEGLELEDIKSQVLHNHILPLSRPGTPFSDAGRSVASAFSFAKMEDMTAVVTAITVQTLPALSKLSRLLHIWGIRLIVLRKVPSLLIMLADAEVALQSGWSAIEFPLHRSPGSNISNTNNGSPGTHLIQKDFDVIKTVLQQKVVRPGRELDFMLDTLEGMVDTLPEKWLDRMELIERNYADWVSTAEARVTESECSSTDTTAGTTLEPPPQTPRSKPPVQDESPTKMPLSPGFYSPDYSDRGTFRDASVEPELPHLPDPDQPFSSDAISPPSSPPLRYKPRTTSVTFKDLPEMAPLPEVDDSPPLRSRLELPEVFDPDASFEWDSSMNSPSRMSTVSSVQDDDHLQRQLRELLQTIPAKIELKRRGINLNPPDLVLPSRAKPRHAESSRRPHSALSSRAESRATTPFSRSGTPSFMLAPVRDTRPRSTSSQGIRLYHLARAGETPIKLFIRCVGEQNERVMVRVGGGWSDLGEYLRDYAIHHGSRSKGEGKVEITDAALPPSKHIGSSPASRPPSRPGSRPVSRPGTPNSRPMTPLTVRKTRRNPAEEGVPGVPRVPKTPMARASTSLSNNNTPASETSVRSRASSQVDWDEEDSSLGLAGPKAAKRREISEEGRAWIESVRHKVRLASGERMAAPASNEQLRTSSSSQSLGHSKKTATTQQTQTHDDNKFGEMGKVGSTKRLFRKN
ncbi:hypothetical protein F4808DRAFT_453009 [Astrocystis sublimbata]|nr:hypothetical protein F4808DRAFT_453009 [Astrocystis sublimbata]